MCGHSSDLPVPANDTELIHVEQMPQQLWTLKQDDDWTGVTSSAERRKLQNRLNQRIYRSRHQAQKPRSKRKSQSHANSKLAHLDQPQDDPQASPPSASDTTTPNKSNHTFFLRHNCGSRALLHFENIALKHYYANRPETSHLITVSKLNIQRAFADNISSLGMTHAWMFPDDAISIFAQLGPLPASSPTWFDVVPPALRPTELQISKPHHPWLDVFPFPGMRDNMIRMGHEWDDEDLCVDLCHSGNVGLMMMIWGEPWEPRNWEITEAFVRKWGLLMDGCGDLMESTDQWRRRRGEKPLFGRERIDRAMEGQDGENLRQLAY